MRIQLNRKNNLYFISIIGIILIILIIIFYWTLSPEQKELYIAKKGDTFSKIYNKLSPKITYSEFQKMNQHLDDNNYANIIPGDTIYINYKRKNKIWNPMDALNKNYTFQRIINYAFFVPFNLIINKKNSKSYNLYLTKIHETKKRIKKASVKEKQKFLNDALDGITRFWYTAGWNFYGATKKPYQKNIFEVYFQKNTSKQKGIACGHFVTACLHDLGFNFDRYSLGGKPASTIIRRFCNKNSIHTFTSLQQMENEIERQGEGFYIIGLSKHTAFVQNKKGKLYIIHSNYGYPRIVMKEKIYGSNALQSSKIYMIGKLFTKKYPEGF
jgi:hypothetical protein